MKQNNNDSSFFELLRAGLWEREVRLSPFKDIDFSEVYRLAEEQSVIGLVAAGLEHVSDVKVPQEWALLFASQTLQLEQRNKAMNAFVAKLIKRLREEDVYTLLVKGQGIAQCYERPLWRACGDVDLFLDKKNYRKAQILLSSIACDIKEEISINLHQAMTIDGWCVELHGTLRSLLGQRIDHEIDEIQMDVFNNGNVRVWNNEGVDIVLPDADNDAIFVFTHILRHYFGGGIGMRQICDWCRLLYTYRESLNRRLLESRLRKMSLLPHWKAFAALAVDTLGMPVEAMPLYHDDKRWHKKGIRILSLIMESGNFGHGRDVSYKEKYPKLIEYLISFGVYTRYCLLQFRIFPFDAIKGWMRIITKGMRSKMKKR